MQARMKNPALLQQAALNGLMAAAKAVNEGPLPKETRDLVHLRVSQINGCAVCIDLHMKELGKQVLTDDKALRRAMLVAAWREAPYYTEPERAALALAECVTRLADESDPVPDDVWERATKHYDEAALSSLLLFISIVNVWNRLNASTRQIAGQQTW